MGNALQFGSTSTKCDQKDWQGFEEKFLQLMADWKNGKKTSADIKKDAQDLDTVCVSFQSSKSPGFFQRLNTACSATGTDVFPYISPGTAEPKNMTDFTDNISIWHSKVGVDWVRVGLSAGVLFLFLVVILLLMRGSSAPRYG